MADPASELAGPPASPVCARPTAATEAVAARALPGNERHLSRRLCEWLRLRLRLPRGEPGGELVQARGHVVLPLRHGALAGREAGAVAGRQGSAVRHERFHDGHVASACLQG
jgi:hypothetical protein